eukprot:TRINITY_DN12860_c0_g1_i1.p1 TRINITY_DN12860_c0_g1~~TRINITY_DN12860_c0_g1_i1.p1  ORF type:complete len:1214 (-),score=234.59 TRINITY_DN12860_c0_g1_i1:35-3676(-)
MDLSPRTDKRRKLRKGITGRQISSKRERIRTVDSGILTVSGGRRTNGYDGWEPENEPDYSFCNTKELSPFGVSIQLLYFSQNKKSINTSINWFNDLTDYILHFASKNLRLVEISFKRVITEEGSRKVKGNIDIMYRLLSEGRYVNWPLFEIDELIMFLLLFIDKLPEPLMSFELHDILIGASFQIWEDEETQISYLHSFINALPELNVQILKKILQIFSRFVDRKKCAEVLGPLLMLRKRIHDVRLDLSDVFDLAHLLLDNYQILTSVYVKTMNENWLDFINGEKMKLFQQVLSKLSSLKSLLRDIASKNQTVNLVLNVIDEYRNYVAYTHKRLSYVNHFFELTNPKKYLDTFHLYRFFRYLSDLYDSILTESSGESTTEGISNFIYQLSIPILRAPLEKLFMFMLVELDIFMEYVELFLFDDMKIERGEYIDDLSFHTSEYISNNTDINAAQFWSERIGAKNMVIDLDRFIQILCDVYNQEMSIPLQNNLREFIDVFFTEIVTPNRFIEFWQAFSFKGHENVLSTCKELFSCSYFYPRVKKNDAVNLLSSLVRGSFLVRMSSQSGSLAYSWRGEARVEHALILTSVEGYSVGDIQVETLNELVDYYVQTGLLKTSVACNPYSLPCFYYDLSRYECEYYLSHQDPGTFLVRYSQTENACIVCSYVSESRDILHCKLYRQKNGTLRYQSDNIIYLNLEDFLRKNKIYFSSPYVNTVSLQMELDESDKSNLGLGVKRSYFKLKHIFKSQETVGDEEMIMSRKIKLSRSRSRTILKQVRNNSFRMNSPPVMNTPITKSDKGERKSESVIKSRSKSKIKVDEDEYTIIEKDVSLNVATRLSWKAVNGYKQNIRYRVLDPVDLNSRYLVTIINPEGTIKKMKKGKKKSEINLEILVVLYHPVVIENMIRIEFIYEKSDIHCEWVNVALLVFPSKDAIIHFADEAPYWNLGKDEIERGDIIGQGAFAVVEKTKLYGVSVAVKKWAIGSKQRPPADFDTEIAIFTQLRHNNLVQFVGAQGSSGVAFIVTEFCINSSLDQFLDGNCSRLRPKEIMLMALDAANGMNFLHMHNKIHRDLKSLNLLVTSKMTVKVADFGITTDDSEVRKLTNKAGTLNWMAPEVLNTGKFGYSTKADVFSFGVILWELVERKIPDRTDEMISKGEIQPMESERWSDFPESYTYLMNTCIRFHPQKRPSFFMIIKSLNKIKMECGNEITRYELR